MPKRTTDDDLRKFRPREWAALHPETEPSPETRDPTDVAMTALGLWDSWQRALSALDGTDRRDRDEQTALDALVEYVEANGLNHTKFDPRPSPETQTARVWHCHYSQTFTVGCCHAGTQCHQTTISYVCPETQTTIDCEVCHTHGATYVRANPRGYGVWQCQQGCRAKFVSARTEATE